MTNRSFCSRGSIRSTDSDSEVYQQGEISSTVRPKRSDRGGSCFSRAARSIRKALSRICRVRCHTFTQTLSPCLTHSKVNSNKLKWRGKKQNKNDCTFEMLTPNGLSKRRIMNGYPEEFFSCEDLCTDFNFYGLEAKRRRVDSSPAQTFDSCVAFDCSPNDLKTHEPEVERSSRLLSIISGTNTVDTKVFVEASLTNTMPTHRDLQNSSTDSRIPRKISRTLRCSHSLSSLSPTSARNETLARSKSLENMKISSNFEEFTPDVTVDEDDVIYRYQCSGPGLYKCTVTGLVFQMKGEGDVVYRTVPWNRRLLVQHHKKPAGPLFDIRCPQQSVCQLHLPHCEVRSTGGCGFLSVAHVTDEGIGFIGPHRITETHVVIDITGFSGYGNVKDADSPPDPVRALVLLFYRPPADPDPQSQINVLLLPKNVCLWDVQRTRRKLVGDERYIETTPHCKLLPNQLYALLTSPHDDSVEVQPTEAEFIEDCYDNYFPSFQVDLEKLLKHIKLILRDTNTSLTVWERRVCLPPSGKSCGPSALNVPSTQRLLDIRSSFTDRISGPVLKSLLDKLLEKKVMSDSEREAADGLQNRGDTARFVIDAVRKKGEAASSEMIGLLSELDPFLCEHLQMT